MRRNYHSDEVGGEVMLFDSMYEMACATAKSQLALSSHDNCKINPKQAAEGWTGITPRDWDGCVKLTTEPWPKAVDQVQSIISSLVEGDALPRPKSRKRVRRFSEDDGCELSLERFQAGHDWWETTYRANRRGPSTVTILTNLDAGCATGPYSIFWRGAAAIAATDILENAGYLVELFMWCKGCRVYPSKSMGRRTDVQLTILRLKEAGNPPDIQKLCCSLSAWYLRVMVFGSFHLASRTPKSIGGADFTLLPIDIAQIDMEGAFEVQVPVSVKGLDGAIKAAKDVVLEVIKRNEGGELDENEVTDQYEKLATYQDPDEDEDDFDDGW